MKRLLSWLLVMVALLWVSLETGNGAPASRWFRGVEGVSQPHAGIDDTIFVRVRDLDGWLLSEMDRHNLSGQRHFKDNQLDLFLSQRKQAQAAGKEYGDLMSEEQDRLKKEYLRLAELQLKLAKGKVAAARESKMEGTTAAAVAGTAPAALPDGTAAAGSVVAAAVPTEEEGYKKAKAKADADLEIWFAKWQAFQAYQRFFHEVTESLYLVLNGHRLTHVKVRNPFETGHDEGTTTIYVYEFVLKQHPADKAEWDPLYDGVTRLAPVSLTVGFDVEGKGYTLDTMVQPDPHPEAALAAAPGQSYDHFALVTYGFGTMTSALGLVAVAFAAFLYLAGRSELVRDPGQPRRPDGQFPFSLSRCQMAFWFFLFAAAYVFLWVVKRQTDTLTDQCLVLLGISTGTTIGSALLSNGGADGSAGGGCPPAGLSRADYLKKTRVQRFFEDILSDCDQITFHRFQMAIWTLVLGLVFVRSVCWGLQMPQFGTNELTLMGISAGTYIGFKIPAAGQTTSTTPPTPLPSGNPPEVPPSFTAAPAPPPAEPHV